MCIEMCRFVAGVHFCPVTNENFRDAGGRTIGARALLTMCREAQVALYPYDYLSCRWFGVHALSAFVSDWFVQ